VASGTEEREQLLEVDVRGERSFAVAGELDEWSSSVLTEVVGPRAAPGGEVWLNIEGLTFLDAGGLRSFLSIASQLGQDGRLYLEGPRGIVRRVLDLSRVAERPAIVILD
jgi:anti-anti-sigma factor